MARKRRNSSSSESEDLPSTKRARPFSIDDFELEYESMISTNEAPKVNPIYGQKGAFPGLDNGGDDDDELFYGPASNGLEYLRMVRSEAKGVPHILVGPNETSEANHVNDYADNDDEGVREGGGGGGGGYYEDGAFIAVPDSQANPVGGKDSTPDAQEVYYLALSTRFKELRRFLHKTPPLSAIEALTSDHPISLPAESTRAQQQWRFLLQAHEAQMTQLACMDMESVLEVIKILKGLLATTVRSRSRSKMIRLGAWIWGVLGRCHEAGQLGSEEISELRELGKRAVGLLVGIRDRSGNAYGQDDDEVELSEEEKEIAGAASAASHTAEVSVSVSHNATVNCLIPDPAGLVDDVSEISELEHAKAMLQKRLSRDDQNDAHGVVPEEGEIEEDNLAEDGEMPVNKQIRATLDMIITVVGEFYGQRDLLECRDIWEGDESSQVQTATAT